MKMFNIFKAGRRYFAAGLLCLAMVIGFNATAKAAYSDWSYGIGTGFFALNLDGDIGWDTALAGSRTFNIDMDANDVADLVETAFGFAGYATDGKWMINYSYSFVELDGNGSNAGVTANVVWERSNAEVTLGYNYYQTPSLILGVLGGARWTKHELATRTTSGGSTVSKNLENDWTDVVVGLTLGVPLAEKWGWNNRADAAFGQSDGTYSFYSGVTWRFHKHWSGTLYGKYTAVDFEESSRGNPDWYLYDIDEFGPGIAVAVNW